MEWFDICDINGNPTGEIVERTEAHAKGICHRTAHIWVIRQVGENWQVLLQKRSSTKDSFPGRWDTSSAGHIQAGDEPLVSAARELGEELGIYAEESQLHPIGTFYINYQKEFYGKIFHDNEVAFVYLYREPVELEDLVLQVEEVEETNWFPFEEVLRGVREHDKTYCVPKEGLELLGQHLGLI